MSETGTTSAPKTVDPEVAAKKAADKAAKLAAKVQKKADAKVAKEASKQPKQNDVRRPKPATVTGKVWAIFDDLSGKAGSPATIGDSLKAATGVPEATVRTQYARWRKFHGIVGRTTAPAVAETAAA